MIKIPLLLLLHLVIATSLFGISLKKSNISIAKQATENSDFKNYYCLLKNSAGIFN